MTKSQNSLDQFLEYFRMPIYGLIYEAVNTTKALIRHVISNQGKMIRLTSEFGKSNQYGRQSRCKPCTLSTWLIIFGESRVILKTLQSIVRYKFKIFVTEIRPYNADKIRPCHSRSGYKSEVIKKGRSNSVHLMQTTLNVFSFSITNTE